MKEKRYFYDWMITDKPKKGIGLATFFICILIITISTSIYYNLAITKYGYELDTYPESTYSYLDSIATRVINEGRGIDVSSIPEDVVKYDIIKERDFIVFKYYLDNNKGMKFAPSASMTVNLSDNFNIISKEPNCSSESEYIQTVKLGMFIASFFNGIFIFLIFLLITLVAGSIATFVSCRHKNRDIKKEENLS